MFVALPLALCLASATDVAADGAAPPAAADVAAPTANHGAPPVAPSTTSGSGAPEAAAAASTPADGTLTTTTTTADDARPAAAPAARPGARRLTRSLATTAWPVEPSVAAGFVLAGDTMVPWAGATAFVPLFFSAGPVVAGRVLGTSTGTLDVVEGIIGAGLGWQGRLGEARARASVVPGVMFSTSSTPSGMLDAPGGNFGLPGRVGTMTSTAVMVPFELGLPLGGGVSFTGLFEPTISTAAAYVDDNGLAAYSRNRVFVFVGVGLDVGGPLD